MKKAGKEQMFEKIDISGDVGLKVSGKTRIKLFLHSADGLYSLITDPAKVCCKKTINIRVDADNVDVLFIRWLNELIFQFDARGFIGKKIHIRSCSDTHLVAVIEGELFDPQKHSRGLLIKAATYHRLKMLQDDTGWHAEVIFDI